MTKPTLCVQRQDGLYRDVDAAKLVALKHDLAHLLPVLERVHRRLRQEDLAAGRINLELFEKSVVPQVLHILPLLHHAIFHRVADLEQGARRGRLVAAHDVLDGDAGQGCVVALFLRAENRAADDRRVLKLGEVLRGVADLEEARTSIEDCEVESAGGGCR